MNGAFLHRNEGDLRFVGLFQRMRRRSRAKAAKATVPVLLTAPTGVGPDFMCIGAQKGGTGWLYDQLNPHPDFWMPAIKELHYFRDHVALKRARPLFVKAKMNLQQINEHRKKSGVRPLDGGDLQFLEAVVWLKGQKAKIEDYARLFNPKGNLLSGDITGAYAHLPEERVSEIIRHLPNVKVLYLARDPIARFWSQYCMMVRKKDWTNPGSLSTVKGFITSRPPRRASENVARWRRFTPENQFRLFYFDDLKTDAADLRARIINFIGGDPDKPSGPLPPNFNRKGSHAKVEMSDEVKELLIDVFADELRASAVEFGGIAEEWPKRYGL